MSETTEKPTGRRIDFSCEVGFKIQDVHCAPTSKKSSIADEPDVSDASDESDCGR